MTYLRTFLAVLFIVIAQIPNASGQTSPNGLSSCRFILNDEGCSIFFGMTKPTIMEKFGQPEGYGDYPDLGLFFYFNADKVDEITFYGAKNNDHNAFYGDPDRRLKWNASAEDTIRQFGEPTKRWVSDDRNESSLSYGDTVRLHFAKGKLTEIILRDPKADARYLAWRAEMDAKESREREQQAAVIRNQVDRQINNAVAQEAVKYVISEYTSMHDRVEDNIRRAGELSKEARKLQLQGMGNLARQKRDSINKILADSRKLIDAFMLTHGSSIPASLKQHLLEDLATLKGI